MQLTRPHPNLGEAGYLLSGFVGAAIFGGIAVSKSVDLLTLLRLLAVGFALGWVTVSDLRERRIPNRVTIPAIAVCLGLSVIRSGEGARPLTALGVCVPLLAVGLFFPRVLGMGDVKLVVLIMVGFGGAALEVLELALVIAASAVVIRGRHNGFSSTIPLAPFLGLAACLAMGL
jgi:hypothetical protein